MNQIKIIIKKIFNALIEISIDNGKRYPIARAWINIPPKELHIEQISVLAQALKWDQVN